MSFTVQLKKTSGDTRRLVKTLTDVVDLSGTLRDNCSVLTPTVTVASSVDDIVTANYCYIPKFKRYYYITDMTSVRNGLTEISMRVDVLGTYQDDILDCYVQVDREGNTPDLYLQDNLPLRADNYVCQKKFNESFGTGRDIIMAVAGY